MVSVFFYLVNLKLVSRPMWISSPLKFEPRGNIASIIFSRNCNSHNQNSQFNKSEKNLSSTSVNVNSERP